MSENREQFLEAAAQIMEEQAHILEKLVDAPTESELNRSVDIAKYEYISGLQYANYLMRGIGKNKAMSARNIQRALFAAIDNQITDSQVKFTTRAEAELAGIFAKILDLRTIIQAAKMAEMKNNQTQTSVNKTEEKNDETNDTNKN